MSNGSKTCSVEGCTQVLDAHCARGFCQRHYKAWRRLERKRLGDFCLVDGCEHSRESEGLCNMHYLRLRNLGDVGDAAPMRSARLPSCSIDGCDDVVLARSYCTCHYQRWRLHGDPHAKVWRDQGTGTFQDGYLYHQSGGRKVSMQRKVMEEMLGRPLRKGETVHHKNGLRRDNRPVNLELWASNHPPGQRVQDLAEWVVEQYPELVLEVLRREWRVITQPI